MLKILFRTSSYKANSSLTRCFLPSVSKHSLCISHWLLTHLQYSTNQDKNSLGSDTKETKKRNDGKKDRKVPRLIYVQHPLKYLKNRWDMLKLKLFWDISFCRKDFLHGSRKALEVVTDYIRNQNAVDLHDVTTPGGFKQITRDMILSKADPRMQLMKFRLTDIQTAIPARVYLIKTADRRHCLIDVFFVGMRNVTDFENLDELNEISERVRKYDTVVLNDKEFHSNRIIFAEVYVRFYREFTKGAPVEWSVGLYKVANFDVI